MSEWSGLRVGGRRDAEPAPPHALELACAWCGRVFRDGAWALAGSPSAAATTHGICPDCSRPLLAPGQAA